MKDIEKIKAEMVEEFKMLVPEDDGTATDWFRQSLTIIENQTLETQALALEGKNEEVKSTACWLHVETALQQAADHLRAQKITK